MIFKRILTTLVYIIILSVFTFYINLFVIQYFELAVGYQDLVFAYFGNAIMAFLVVAIMFFLEKKYKDQLGFVFMATSFLKFLLFFLFFYPGYNADGVVSKQEFLVFFIPYFIFLIFEITVLSRFLNKIDG